MDIDTTFNELTTAAKNFVQASSTWRQQVDTTQLDSEDQALFLKLEQLENEFTQWTECQIPPDITAFSDFHANGDTLLTKANSINTSLPGISQTSEAQTKESETWKRFRDLNKMMKRARDRLPSTQTKPWANNRFLSTMQGLVDKTAPPGNVAVTQPDFESTIALFGRNNLSLNDTQLNQLINSWTTVIAYFISSTNKISNDSKSIVKAEAEFLIMHSLLENLFDRVADQF